MKLLSRSEEIILLTIIKLGDHAYGVRIRQQIADETGDTWSFASIYQPLDKLVRKRYVHRSKGKPGPERGARSRYYYRITKEGEKALLKIRRAQDRLWSGRPQALLEKPE